MRNVAILFFLLLFPSAIRAQTYHVGAIVSLPDSIPEAMVEAVDIDHDGLQDILIFAESTKGKKYLYVVRGDTVNAPALAASVTVLPDFTRYLIVDADLDNQLDIVFSANDKTIVLNNRGNLDFVEMETGLPAFSALRFADLDGDGRPECILSGTENLNPYTRTYKRVGDSGWEIRHDSLTYSLSAIEATDMDGNGITDVIFSGRESDGSRFTSIFLAEDGKFVERRISPAETKLLLVDTDVDGLLDLVAFGETDSGYAIYNRYRKTTDFAAENLIADGKVFGAFHADLNSDGIPDQHSLSINSANDTLNVIRFSGGAEENLPVKNLRQQRFYDLDHDGDLDLIQLGGETLIISWFENTTKESNEGPNRLFAAAIPVFNRVLLYWDRTGDDHTQPQSITYDVYLEGSTVGTDVAFDIDHGQRLRPAHGNNGTNNFLLLRNKSESFNFAIQPVDNALYASPEGICYGNSVPCGEPEHEVITVCTAEAISIPAPDGALWFSFSKGFLGESTSYNYEPQSQDTVFYLLPTGACPVVRTFEFKMEEVKLLEGEDIIACANAEISLGVDDTVIDAQWSSDQQGSLGESATITFKTRSDDVVLVRYKNQMQCEFEKRFAITVSIPLVATEEDVYRVMKGQSVQLSAKGAAAYRWTPSEGLNNAQVANPVASPTKDTRYVVTGTDSIGCTASAVIDVIVESTGFIPSLFTPNADGQNDFLKVYGLVGVEEFSLRIVNREGSVVFQTSNLTEAAGLGWNGTTNGVLQPNGVYFWKVEGRLPSGNRILLNGKKEGSLVLLR